MALELYGDARSICNNPLGRYPCLRTGGQGTPVLIVGEEAGVEELGIFEQAMTIEATQFLAVEQLVHEVLIKLTSGWRTRTTSYLPYAELITNRMGSDVMTVRPNVARWFREISARLSWVAIKDGLYMQRHAAIFSYVQLLIELDPCPATIRLNAVDTVHLPVGYPSATPFWIPKLAQTDVADPPSTWGGNTVTAFKASLGRISGGLPRYPGRHELTVDRDTLVGLAEVNVRNRERQLATGSGV
ncbi:hypothetical protein DFH09DRAFT_1086511 [Mycena vulgaris]|nr:hypothetical protein DFH09DRAFT_1086511 [Mycena vulgaris]